MWWLLHIHCNALEKDLVGRWFTYSNSALMCLLMSAKSTSSKDLNVPEVITANAWNDVTASANCINTMLYTYMICCTVLVWVVWQPQIAVLWDVGCLCTLKWCTRWWVLNREAQQIRRNIAGNTSDCSRMTVNNWDWHSVQQNVRTHWTRYLNGAQIEIEWTYVIFICMRVMFYLRI